VALDALGNSSTLLESDFERSHLESSGIELIHRTLAMNYLPCQIHSSIGLWSNAPPTGTLPVFISGMPPICETIPYGQNIHANSKVPAIRGFLWSREGDLRLVKTA